MSANFDESPEALEQTKKELWGHRFRFGFTNLLFQGEETSLGNFKTAILKNLGATDRHFAIVGTFAGFTQIFQFLAVPLLNHYRSFYRSMSCALKVGILAASMAGGAVLLGNIPNGGQIVIWLFLAWSLVMAIATGVQINVETSWTGELVPRQLLGWFTSVKYIICVLGVATMGITFSGLFDYFHSMNDGYYFGPDSFQWLRAIFPHPGPYFWTYWICCALYLVVALSHVLAIILTSKVPDRVPEKAKLVTTNRSERINYKALPLWTYLLFLIFWSGGRGVLSALRGIFLMRVYGLRLTSLAILDLVTLIVQVLALHFFGRISDRKGARKPLILISTVVAASMYLWPLTAWIGWRVLYLYYIIVALGGFNHNMLLNNYGIEIFPSKGRAAYFGVVRLILGIVCILLTLGAGEISNALEGFSWSMQLWGATVTHYHLIFFCATTFTLFSIIPLLLIGNRTVKPLEDKA